MLWEEGVLGWVEMRQVGVRMGEEQNSKGGSVKL